MLIAFGVISGCGNIAVVRSFSTPYAEPVDGEMARIRVISDGMVRAVPGKTCVDWRSPGAGVMVSAQKGFANLNGRNLGMPKNISRYIEDPESQGIVQSELRISAGKPIVLNFIGQGHAFSGHKHACHESMSFVPKAGAYYEALFLESGSYCLSEISELASSTIPGMPKIVSTNHAALCNLSDFF